MHPGVWYPVAQVDRYLDVGDHALVTVRTRHSDQYVLREGKYEPQGEIDRWDWWDPETGAAVGCTHFMVRPPAPRLRKETE